MEKKISRRTIIIMGVILFIALALMDISPLGVTSHQLQNRMFRMHSIETAPDGGGIRVKCGISVRNFIPAAVRFDAAQIKPMGEYSTLISGFSANALPLELGFMEKAQLEVSYLLDAERFASEYLSGWQKTGEDPAKALERFIKEIVIEFESEDVPTGRSLCMN